MTALFVRNGKLEPWGRRYTFVFRSTEVVGSEGGSRGEMRRMRTKPDSPVELAWRWGRATRLTLAKWRFIDTTADTSERSAQRGRLAL